METRADKAAMDLATSVNDAGVAAADYVNHGHDDGNVELFIAFPAILYTRIYKSIEILLWQIKYD